MRLTLRDLNAAPTPLPASAQVHAPVDAGGNGSPNDADQDSRPPETTRRGRRADHLVYPWERRLVRGLLSSLHNPPLQIELWNGETFQSSSDATLARIRFRTRSALLKTILSPDRFFGDGYTSGEIAVDGDLVAFLEEIYRRMGPLEDYRPLALRRRLGAPGRSRNNIHHHYDIGNAFYRLWLDERMVYTCAYFESPTAGLEKAQLAKMDHVCRKLRLRPGEHVIEAGCGWGALALHMATRYGVHVRAFNISHEQIAYARNEAQRAGFTGRVEFVKDDYRNIRGSCDAFVSVGMLEHVGIANYRDLGAVIDRCLPPAGRGLIHSIGHHKSMRLNRWIATRIFPGAEIPTLGDMTAIFEPYDFCILDVENLRLHYAQTLRHWLERFERAAGQVEAMFDARFMRAWRLYLAGSLAAFTSGSLQLFQVVFNRCRNNDVPLTRAHLYQNAH